MNSLYKFYYLKAKNEDEVQITDMKSPKSLGKVNITALN